MLLYCFLKVLQLCISYLSLQSFWNWFLWIVWFKDLYNLFTFFTWIINCWQYHLPESLYFPVISKTTSVISSKFYIHIHISWFPILTHWSICLNSFHYHIDLIVRALNKSWYLERKAQRRLTDCSLNVKTDLLYYRFWTSCNRIIQYIFFCALLLLITMFLRFGIMFKWAIARLIS